VQDRLAGGTILGVGVRLCGLVEGEGTVEVHVKLARVDQPGEFGQAVAVGLDERFGRDTDARARGEVSEAIRLAGRDERVRRRAERHVDERTIAAHDRSQFLPSSLDADQVREALTAVTAAQTGWEYLRDAVPPGELLALLDMPAIARLGSGVVVPVSAADNAVACLEGRDIRTTSLVSVYTAVAADAIVAAARVGDAAEDAPAWTALRRGLVDQDEAAATVRFLKERVQASQREDAELAHRRAADQALRDQIATFLEDCPAGKLEAIDADISYWDAKRREIEQAQDAAQEALKGLDAADRAADKESAEISKSLRKVDSTLDWLDELIPALREEESLRQALSEQEERAVKAAKRASDHAERQASRAKSRASISSAYARMAAAASRLSSSVRRRLALRS
jgi:hypothetical protein